jgi:hypothetical protein
MNGADLAIAIAHLCRAKPDLDKKLQITLAKWVKDNVAKGPTLESLRECVRHARPLMDWYISQLTVAEAASLLKKLDPDRPKSPSDNERTLKAHAVALVINGQNPFKKAPKPPGLLTIKDVLAIRDSVKRKSELDCQKLAALKKAVKDLSIDPEQLSSKIEIIEHIEAAIASGWPSERSIMDTSKFR